jgi:hypothetical protein
MNRKKSVPAKKTLKKIPIPGKPSVSQVEVVNSATKPIPAQQVRPAGWEPVFCGNSVPFADGQRSINAVCVLTSPTLRQVDTVPAGKRLVIEFITADIFVPSGQYVDCSLIARLGNASTGFRIKLDKIQNVNGSDVYVTSQPAALYTDENRSVEMYINRSPFTGTGHAVVMCSGHLENMG